MTKPSEDSILLQRFLDDELSAEEHQAFQQRIDRDPALAEVCTAERSLRGCFAKGRDQVVVTPADLAQRVMEQVRKQPSREDLERLVGADGGAEVGTIAAPLGVSLADSAEVPRGVLRGDDFGSGGDLVSATRFAQRLAVAALLILGLGLILLSGLFGGGNQPTSLTASPDELKQSMDDLDARIRAEAAAAEANAPR